MKLKPILIAVLLLAVIALIAKWLQRPMLQPQEGRAGESLISHEIVEAARQIHLSKPSEDAMVTLSRSPDNTWILPGYHNFEVDFSKLESLIRSLLEAKVDRTVTKDPKRLERLKLGQNLLEFKSSDSESLLVIETGKRSPSGGTFVRFEGDDSVYLSDLSLYLDTNESNWPQTKLLSFTPTEVKRLRIGNVGDALEIHRIHRESADAPFTSNELNKDRKINDSEVKNLLRTLTNARFSKVTEKDDPDASTALAHAREFKLTLFNGSNYNLLIGRKPAEPIQQDPIDEHADATAPAEALIAGTDEPPYPEDLEETTKEPEVTDPGPLFIFYSTSDPANRLNKIMDRIALIYPNYIFKQINDALEKIVEEVKPEGGELVPVKTSNEASTPGTRALP